MSKWNRDRIIRAIVSLETDGQPLCLGRHGGVQQGLYQAGSRVFGSWRNALAAAGVAPGAGSAARERWPGSRVVAAIRSLSRRRLRPGELAERYGALVQAARRRFGTWSKAVLAAGVDPARLQSVSPWTRERIIEAILTRALKDEPLGSRTVRPRSLAEAGAKVFGTWSSALAAAGLDPKSCARSPRAEATSTRDNAAVANACVLTHAAGGAGVARRSPFRRWSDPKVLDTIRERLSGNRAMNAKSVYRDDRSLYRAATRRFGNWSNALTAAGLDPAEFHKRPPRPRVADIGRSVPVPPAAVAVGVSPET